MLFGKKKKENKEKSAKAPQKEQKSTKTVAKKAPAEKTETKAKPAKTDKTETKAKPAKTEKTETKAKAAKTEKKTAKVAKKALYRVLFDKTSRLWLIKKDGAKRTIASFVTKEEALNRVKELSAAKDLSFVVHKKDGKFQKKQ